MRNGYDIFADESLIIGRVDEVSPSFVTVSVDPEAPNGTSLVHGALQRFPRVNGFVVLPCESGAILAVVTWIGIVENRPSPAGPDMLGLPTPKRRLRAIPLGVLRASDDGEPARLERGALLFPTVGDPVRLPTSLEARSAVPNHDAAPLSGGLSVGLVLGTAPMASHETVAVGKNRLFGRHLAILGNTGSGKSCSLTHLLRESARESARSGGSFRAIVLDLNGEYSNAFDGLLPGVTVRRFAMEPTKDGPDASVAQLRVPYWLWNYREWHAFADPSDKSQAPVLRQALHVLRTSGGGGWPEGVVTLVMGRRVVLDFRSDRIRDMNTAASLSLLENVMNSCSTVARSLGDHSRPALQALHTRLKSVLDKRRDPRPNQQWRFGASGPDLAECGDLIAAFDGVIEQLELPDLGGDVSSIDRPDPFDALNLAQLLNVIAAGTGPDVASWTAPMQDRIEVAMSDHRLRAACGYLEDESLESWLTSLLGNNKQGQISVLDLSLVPASAQHIVAAVVARTLLEALERHRRVGSQVPVVLAVEEAHALMRRGSDRAAPSGTSAMADLCREAFERIGREGRKFGLSMVVSSQRPSELSETVLSQCNSYLVHRIVNARDQDFVRRLVPDDLGELLAEVASYPARTALLVGAAADIPVLVEVAELDPRYRPNSADPDFEGAWRDGADFLVTDLIDAWTPKLPLEEDPPADDWPGDGSPAEDRSVPPF